MSGLPPRPAFPPATLPHTPHADDVLVRRWGALLWLGQPCQPAGQFHLLPLPTMLADYHRTWRLQCIMSALSHHCLYWCDLLYAAAADCNAEGDGTFHEPQKCCIKTSINITTWLSRSVLLLSQSCEEEVLVWVFPSHECQKKSFQVTRRSRVTWRDFFWHEWLGKTHTSTSDSQDWHSWKIKTLKT